MRPFVSLCTPTYNRRPFVSAMLDCFRHQDYPKDRMEWIIVDDGSDSIADLIAEANVPQIKYIRLDVKVPLGKKRNVMHAHATGDILVYMDDDDYYPPTRVSHAVDMLQRNPSVMIAGCSSLNIYFKHLDKIIQFGPYAPNHATAATFAFRKALLNDTAYDDAAVCGEEKSFLKNYSVPLVQLDPMHVILVFSHEHNTFDKRILLQNPSKTIMTETTLRVSDIVREAALADFYVNQVHAALVAYAPGYKTPEFSIVVGSKILRGAEIVTHLNYQQQYITSLEKRIRQLLDKKVN